MRPGPTSLQRLATVAGALRDRDLHALAMSSARLREIDRQLDLLERVQEASRNALRSIADPREVLRHEAYADLIGSRRLTLSRDREEQVASVTAMMTQARQSLARANILETLHRGSRQGRVRQDRD
jgi:hypothetical protein